MSLPLLILGGGGHARVLVDALLTAGRVIAGIVDRDPALTGASLLGVPVIGGDELVEQFPPGEILLVNGIGSVGVPASRRRIFENFTGRGYRFGTVVHPSAVVAADVELGEGAQLMAGSVIQSGSRIGGNVIVNTRAAVDHDCIIGDHSHLAPGVTLSGGVQVGSGVHIGTGATLIQGIVIGDNCLIAAGAVVVGSLTGGTKVRGVPAREFS